MGTLLLVTMLAATMTPEEEVEAWDPTAETQAAARPTPKTAADERETQVWNAAGIVTLGTVLAGAGAGAIAAIGYTTVTASLDGVPYAVGNVLVSAMSIGILTGGPIIMLAMFTEGLPVWALWTAGGAVAVGTIAGFFAGSFLAGAFIDAVADPENDCRGCGPEGFALIVLPVAVAVVGGATLGITATTLGVLSE